MEKLVKELMKSGLNRKMAVEKANEAIYIMDDVIANGGTARDAFEIISDYLSIDCEAIYSIL